MVLWDYKLLAHKLHHNEISETDKFRYALIFFITIACLTSIFFTKGTPEDAPYSLYDFALDTLFFSYEILLLYLFAKINRSGDGKNFIERYVILTTVLSIRILLCAAIIAVLLLLLPSIINVFSNMIFLIALLLILLVIYTCYLLSAARIASGKKKMQANSL
jgi:hypothetical protein